MAMFSTYLCYFFILAGLALAKEPDPGVHLTKRGFNATFFKYELGSDIGWRPQFFEQMSASCRGLETVEKVVDMNFHFQPQAVNPNYHNVYRSKQRVTNMGLRLTSFFRPHDSGYYRFNLATHDGAQLTIGPARWPCEHKAKIETHKLKALRARGDQSKESIKVADFYLIRDYYYPVEVIAFNSKGDASLRLSVTDPSGNTYTDFGYLVHQRAFDKCGKSSKAPSNSVFADASLPAKDWQTHLSAANPSMLNELATSKMPPVHGEGYEASSFIKDRTGQRSFGSTGSTVNAHIESIKNLESEDSMVSERLVIAPEYFDSWGFKIDEYKYSVGGKQGWEPDYFTSPMTGEKMQTLKNIDSINYDSRRPENRIYSSRYGSRPKSMGFAAEMSGHFKATMSGMYRFELTADDGAYISIGPAKIPCGRRKRGVRSIFEMTALTEMVRYKEIQESHPVVSQGSVPLQKNMYYPVKVIMFSSKVNSSLQLSVRDPSGSRVSDFGNLVFQARDECGPANMTVSDSFMKTHGKSVETQYRPLSNSDVQSDSRAMQHNDTFKVIIKFSTRKVKSEDTNHVIVSDGHKQSSINVHILNPKKEPEQLTVESPGTIQVQQSGPDPLSPLELAASRKIEAKEKLSRQFRDTTNPKKQIKLPSISKPDESTRESAGPQALSDFQKSAALQLPSKLMGQGAPDKNDEKPGVVDNLLEAAAPKKNATEPDVVGNLSNAATPENSETEPGVGGMVPTLATPKNDDSKPGVVVKSLEKPKSDASTKKQSKPDVSKKSSKKPKSGASAKNQPSPDVSKVPSTVMDQKDLENNKPKPAVGGVLPESATPKKIDTKPAVVVKSSKIATPKEADSKPGVAEKPSKEPKSDASKKKQSKPVVAEKSSKKPKSGASAKNQPSPAALQVPSTVMGQKDLENNGTKPAVGGIVPIATAPKENDTKPDVSRKSSKKPTADVSETSDPKLEVAKELSEVATPEISEKNDRESLNFVNEKGPEENDPKKESFKEPSDDLMKEALNEKKADLVVSEKSSKIVIPDDLKNTGETAEVLQDSLKEQNPDAVTEHSSTPDVLKVKSKELEPHDQKSVVELNPLLREEQPLDVPEPGALEAPSVLISGNLTAAAPVVDAPADSNNSISDEVSTSPPLASGVSLKVDPAGLDMTMTPEAEPADTPVIAIENISANSGSEIPAPKDLEASAFSDSAQPAFSNISMPARSVVQMPVPSEIIAGIGPENVTSTYLNEQAPAILKDPMPDHSDENEQAPAILEDPMPDILDESTPATSLAEALAVSDAPLPIAPEDVLKDIPIEISMGIASVSAAYLSEKALPSLLNDSGANMSNGLRPAVPEVPLLAASQTPVFANLENSELANENLSVLAYLENSVIANDTLPVVASLESSVIANETLPVVASLENSVIANESLPVAAVDEVPETPARKAPIVSIAKVPELKAGASEDPLPLIAFNGSMSGSTNFQKASPESVKQVLRGTNSTATSQSAHGTKVEAIPKERESVPDELRTLEVVPNKRLHENESSLQLQKTPYSPFGSPGPLDDEAQMNPTHGVIGEVVGHIAQDAETTVGNTALSTLNVDSDPLNSAPSITKENFTGNEKKPSPPKPSEAGTMAPVSACLGNNCSSEVAIDIVDVPPSMKGDGLKAASPRMMTLVTHATSAYPPSMPSGEPVRVIMLSDGGSKKTAMLILSTLALEAMVMIL